MRKNSMTLAIIIAVGVSVTSAGAARGAAAPGTDPGQMQGTWDCETTTTQPNATADLHEHERDTIEFIGVAPGMWLHGTARSKDNTSDPNPDYDYYLRYDKDSKLWTYIQIDPKNGKYFVGTSPAGWKALNGSRWTIVYPTGEGNYTFTESPLQFSIAYADLTQVCNKISSSVPAAPAAPILNCQTWRTGQSDPTDEYLSISPMAKNWWQGVAKGPDHRSVIYEYNIFSTQTQRISIEINATTGSYAIATSRISPDLNDSIWTVVYPTVESGFTFTDVSPERAVPQAFTIVFADGYQTCTTPSPSP
jgi:hypothetical protein